MLGPALFIICINYIDAHVSSSVRKFADDTKLCVNVCTCDQTDRLQYNMGKMLEWLEIIIIIILVIRKCYFSGEHIALSIKKRQQCEHRIRKYQQIKSTVYDANLYTK